MNRAFKKSNFINLPVFRGPCIIPCLRQRNTRSVLGTIISNLTVILKVVVFTAFLTLLQDFVGTVWRRHTLDTLKWFMKGSWFVILTRSFPDVIGRRVDTQLHSIAIRVTDGHSHYSWTTGQTQKGHSDTLV